MNKLKKIRKKSNITQKEIAEKLNMTTSNYSKKERGKIPITLSEAQIIVEILKCSFSDLL